MRESKKKRLQARDWRVGGAAELLNLSAQEAAYMELKLKLASDLRERHVPGASGTGSGAESPSMAPAEDFDRAEGTTGIDLEQYRSAVV